MSTIRQWSSVHCRAKHPYPRTREAWSSNFLGKTDDKITASPRAPLPTLIFVLQGPLLPITIFSASASASDSAYPFKFRRGRSDRSSPHATACYLQLISNHTLLSEALKRGARPTRRHCAFVHVGGSLLSFELEQRPSTHASSTFSQPLFAFPFSQPSYARFRPSLHRTCAPVHRRFTHRGSA